MARAVITQGAKVRIYTLRVSHAFAALDVVEGLRMGKLPLYNLVKALE